VVIVEAEPETGGPPGGGSASAFAAGAGASDRASGDPSHGAGLERRCVQGRASEVTPRLWRQRCRLTLLTPPVSGLRFDILEQHAQLS